MRIFWISLIAIGLLGEFFALATGQETLSSTWRWIRDSIPLPLSVLLSATLGGCLLWLMSVHWIFSGLDKPGFDKVEKIFVFVGLLLGALGGMQARKRKEKEENAV